MSDYERVSARLRHPGGPSIWSSFGSRNGQTTRPRSDPRPFMSPRSARRSFAALALSALVSAVLSLVAPAAAFAVVPTAPVKLPGDIEVTAPYQPQTFCSPTVKPGTQALANTLTATYAGTAIVSTVRPCGSDTSEHYDGRAIDWGVDHRNDSQRAKGNAFLHWLFATDAAGHDHAMARRLGVMYVIWNKQMWGAWSGKWEPYTNCSGPTACHVDHMHISLDWSGAMKKTSFWTGVVRAPMAPPLVSIRALHSAVTQTVSLHDDPAQPVYRLVAGGHYRVTVKGTYRYDDRARHHADAECSTSDGTTWSARSAGETPGRFDLVTNGSHYWHPTGAVVNGCSTDHTYRHYVTVDKGTPLRLVINDPSRWLGSGSLTVSVVRIA